VGSGGEALGLLASMRIDLMLMDFLMPDMNGLEAIKHLSTEHRLAGIPVIMATGTSERDLILTSVEMGAVDFIVKPWEHSTMMARIWRALKTGTYLSYPQYTALLRIAWNRSSAQIASPKPARAALGGVTTRAVPKMWARSFSTAGERPCGSTVDVKVRALAWIRR
jgi:CheY-like chemotaxis protein